jgi:hypothetical protein
MNIVANREAFSAVMPRDDRSKPAETRDTASNRMNEATAEKA